MNTPRTESLEQTDDGKAFARYGAELAEAVEESLGDWIRTMVASRWPQPSGPIEARLEAAIPAAVADIGGRLRELLALDLDAQWTNPLSIIRQVAAYPTAVLAEAGLAPVQRDATDTRLYPDDIYGLSPAAFGDLGPRVHECGLLWGAAKAHLHLRRRRQAVGP